MTEPSTEISKRVQRRSKFSLKCLQNIWVERSTEVGSNSLRSGEEIAAVDLKSSGYK